MVRPARLVGALALVLCAACGPGVPRPPGPVDDGLHWHADPALSSWGWGLQSRTYGPPILPEAEHVTEDLDSGPYGRVVVNLTADGEVVFKGNHWELETGDERERLEALDGLHGELARLLVDPEMRKEDGSSQVAGMIYADREAAWANVRALFAVLRRPDIGIVHLQLAVARPPRTFAAARRGTDHRIDLDLRPMEGGHADATDPSRDVRLGARRVGGGTEVELRLAERGWSFGDQDPGLADADVLRRAIEVWADVEAWLAEVRGGAAARLVVDPGDAHVPWAHVVKTLDLLVGAGVREVAVPELDLRLVFEAAVSPPPADLEDTPVVTPRVLRACALAVLLAFAITLFPRPRPSRRR